MFSYSGAFRLSKAISVIICTYGRSTALHGLLHSLQIQRGADFELLIIDGNGETSPARSTVEHFVQRNEIGFAINIIASPRGLTHQRNIGLKAAKGDLICFLD